MPRKTYKQKRKDKYREFVKRSPNLPKVIREAIYAPTYKTVYKYEDNSNYLYIVENEKERETQLEEYHIESRDRKYQKFYSLKAIKDEFGGENYSQHFYSNQRHSGDKGYYKYVLDKTWNKTIITTSSDSFYHIIIYTDNEIIPSGSYTKKQLSEYIPEEIIDLHFTRRSASCFPIKDEIHSKKFDTKDYRKVKRDIKAKKSILSKTYPINKHKSKIRQNLKLVRDLYNAKCDYEDIEVKSDFTDYDYVF